MLESLRLRPGDELLTNDHEYNATLNALATVAARAKARVVRVPIPLPIRHPEEVVEAILAAVSPRTRVALISHVTSVSGLIFPIETIVRELDRLGVDTLVDAAHAPGMVPIDLRALGAAWWTGNGHKWLCGPKGAGVLHVREDRRAGLLPLVTSHGRNDPRPDRPALWKEFDWQGTGNPTAFLALPDAIRVIDGLQPGGWPAHMAANRALALAARDLTPGRGSVSSRSRRSRWSERWPVSRCRAALDEAAAEALTQRPRGRGSHRGAGRAVPGAGRPGRRRGAVACAAANLGTALQRAGGLRATGRGARSPRPGAIGREQRLGYRGGVTETVPPIATDRAATGDAAEEQLDQLRFLHRVARMATTASTWEELLETVVDETRDALHASVSSLYLLDRDAENLTLAATNGLDRYQIGRARVPFGGGVTGRVAASREPLVIPDVSHDDRFLWVRGIDQKRFIASMLSVPLVWNDRTVGVLNVQTEEHRDFSPSDVAHLRAIADLLGGIVEKGRMQREAEARATELKAIDEARAELIAMVTHELRTPLAVVRAYTELLAEEPPLEGRESRDHERRERRAGWYRSTMDQVARLDRLVDSILASVRVGPEPPADLVPTDIGVVVERGRRGARAAARPAQAGASIRHPAVRPDRPEPPPPDPRAPRRERGEVRAAAHHHPARLADEGRQRDASASPTRAPASPRSGGSASSSRTRGARPTRHEGRASGCTPRGGSRNPSAPACGASPPRAAARDS